MKNILLFLLAVCFMVMVPGTVRAYTNEEECGFCTTEPDCCAEIRATKDAFGCSWPIRGYCNMETCSQAEGNKQKCGWYWVFHDANANDAHLGTNTPTGYGCMIGDSEATMHPRCNPTPIPTARPTATPYPTSRPTSLPTRAPLPTLPPAATAVPLPTAPQPTLSVPSPVPSFPPRSSPFQIPTIPLSCTSVDRRLDPFSRLFDFVTFHDRELENFIYIRLLLMRHALLSTFGRN